MLDALIFSDRAIEDDAFFGVVRRPRQRQFAETDGFRRNQDTLGIHAVQDVFEAAALLAEAIFHRNLEVFEKKFVGVDDLAAHLLDLMDLDALAIEIRIERG